MVKVKPNLLEDGVQYRDIEEHFNVPHDFILSGIWWKHLLAGGIAGAISRTSTAPLDRIKVYMQARGCPGMGMLICLRDLLQEGGILSLWRGNGINMLKITPETAVKFWAYQQAKRIIKQKINPSHAEIFQLTIITRFVAGSIAGAFSQTIIYPLEVLKTRFALRKTGEYRSIFQAVKIMYKTEGIRCFYRGYVPNILGIVPYAGIDLAVYETLKTKFSMTTNGEQKAPSAYLLLSCGTISSTSGQLCTYPLALVRTKLQAKVVDINAKSKYTMTSVFKDVIKTEGIRGLYRGLTANVLKVIPAVSISYLIYEKTSTALGINQMGV